MQPALTSPQAIPPVPYSSHPFKSMPARMRWVESQFTLLKQLAPAQSALLAEPLMSVQSQSVSKPRTHCPACQLPPQVTPAMPPDWLKSPVETPKESVRLDVPQPYPPLIPT